MWSQVIILNVFNTNILQHLNLHSLNLWPLGLSLALCSSEHRAKILFSYVLLLFSEIQQKKKLLSCFLVRMYVHIPNLSMNWRACSSAVLWAYADLRKLTFSGTKGLQLWKWTTLAVSHLTTIIITTTYFIDTAGEAVYGVTQAGYQNPVLFKDSSTCSQELLGIKTLSLGSLDD